LQLYSSRGATQTYLWGQERVSAEVSVGLFKALFGNGCNQDKVEIPDGLWQALIRVLQSNRLACAAVPVVRR
jgi:hypothetical protein